MKKALGGDANTVRWL